MPKQSMSFSAKIYKIGINPYVLLPQIFLDKIFLQAKKDKGAIPVCGKLNGHEFIQTLVKYSGKWRLYLNTPMRKATGTDVGDTINIEVDYDPKPRIISIHPTLQDALKKNSKAKKAFEKLSPSRQKEIIRYISFLKTEESIDKNVNKVIGFLTGKGRFAGRDK